VAGVAAVRGIGAESRGIRTGPAARGVDTGFALAAAWGRGRRCGCGLGAGGDAVTAGAAGRTIATAGGGALDRAGAGVVTASGGGSGCS
jgi:hypothetical protein